MQMEMVLWFVFCLLGAWVGERVLLNVPGASLGSSLLALGAGGRDLARGHQVADVLLEKFVVVVKLVVFFANGLDSIEDGEERLLQSFCVALEFLPRFPSQCLNILACSSRTHGANIVGAEGLLDGANGAVAGDDKGAAALASREMRAHWCWSMNVEFLMIVLERSRRRRTRGRAVDVGRAMHTLTGFVLMLVIHGQSGWRAFSKRRMKGSKKRRGGRAGVRLYWDRRGGARGAQATVGGVDWCWVLGQPQVDM